MISYFISRYIDVVVMPLRNTVMLNCISYAVSDVAIEYEILKTTNIAAGPVASCGVLLRVPGLRQLRVHVGGRRSVSIRKHRNRLHVYFVL